MGLTKKLSPLQCLCFCVAAFAFAKSAWARVPDQELSRLESLERNIHNYRLESYEYWLKARQCGDAPWDSKMADWVVREYLLEDSFSTRAPSLLAKTADSPGGLEKLRAALKHMQTHRLDAAWELDHWLRHSDPSRAAEFQEHLAGCLASGNFEYVAEAKYLKQERSADLVDNWLRSGDSSLAAAAELALLRWKPDDAPTREAVAAAACNPELGWYVNNASVDALLEVQALAERQDLFERLMRENPDIALTRRQGEFERFQKPEFIERAVALSRGNDRVSKDALHWLWQLDEKSPEVSRCCLALLDDPNPPSGAERFVLESCPDIPEALPKLRELAGKDGPLRSQAALALARFPDKDALYLLQIAKSKETDFYTRAALAKAIWLAEGASEERAIAALLEEKNWDLHSQSHELAEGLIHEGAPPSMRKRLLKLAATADSEQADRLYRAAHPKHSDPLELLNDLKSGPIFRWEIEQLERAALLPPEKLTPFLEHGGRPAGVVAALQGRAEVQSQMLESQDDEAIVYLLNYSRLLRRKLPVVELQKLAIRDARYLRMVLFFLETCDDPESRRLTEALGAVPGAQARNSDWMKPLLSETANSRPPDLLVAYHGHWGGGDSLVVIRKTKTGWTLDSTVDGAKASRSLTDEESRDFERWFAIHYAQESRDILRPMSHDYFEEVLICRPNERRVLKAVNSQEAGSSGLFLRDICRRMRILGCLR